MFSWESKMLGGGIPSFLKANMHMIPEFCNLLMV